MSDDAVGYKRPPKKYQFGQPGGNIPGITSETRRLQIENAERATRIRKRLLEAVEKVSELLPEEEVLAMIDSNLNTLIKDSENRGLGMPTQQVDQTSSDGSMSPVRAQDAVLEALRNKHKPNGT